MSQLKKGATVRYTARVQQGTGKIAAVRTSQRGAWYDVKTPEGKTLSLRAAQLQPA